METWAKLGAVTYCTGCWCRLSPGRIIRSSSLGRGVACERGTDCGEFFHHGSAGVFSVPCELSFYFGSLEFTPVVPSFFRFPAGIRQVISDDSPSGVLGAISVEPGEALLARWMLV